MALPTSAPLPNPWATSAATTGDVESAEGGGGGGGGAPSVMRGFDRNVKSLGIIARQEGSELAIDLGFANRRLPLSDYTNSMQTRYMLQCCPCCVGTPKLCSSQGRQDLRVLPKTFVFWMTVTQVIMFFVSILIGGFEDPSRNSMLGPPFKTLLDLGAENAMLIKQGEVWRLITPVVLHAGLIHLAFNLFSQTIIGVPMEFRIGTVRFAGVYLASGFVGCLMSAVGTPNSIGVGASGAILGLVGFQLGFLWCTWQSLEKAQRQAQLVSMCVLVLMLLLLGLSSSVDNYAHGGGLLTGVLLGVSSFVHRRELGQDMQQTAKWGALGLLGALVLVLLIVLFVVV
jgi:membrane associated rhomboid family serine protease